MLEGLERESVAQVGAHRAVVAPHLIQHRGVVGAVHDHRDGGVVLGRGAQQGGAADVYVFHRLFQRAARPRHGLLERVEIHDDEVNRRDVMLAQRGDVGVLIAPGEDAAVDLGVQGLEAPVQQLGKAGVVRHLDRLDAAAGEQPGGAAGGQDLDALRLQRAREFDDAVFVRDADQSALDGWHGSRL